MAWTPAQQAAIDQREANILVSAAAGSGKTAVLTERVLKRIIGSEKESPIEIDRFLIVTFTSAAAAEMKERVTHKLSDYMNSLQLGEDLNEAQMEQMSFLERQMALVHRASISTIHSFCLKTIKSYFNELEIDPNIKVGNQAELNLMKQEILEELIEERFDAEEPQFLELAEVYGSVQGMAALIDLILDIDTFSKSTPFPEVWLEEQVKRLSVTYTKLSQMPWSEAIRKNVWQQIQDLLVIYKEAISLCELGNGPQLYKPVLESDLMTLKDLDENSSLEDLVTAINNTNFVALPRKKQECDEALKERVKAYRDLGKEVIKNIQGDLEFIEDPKLLEQLPKVGHLMHILVELIKDFGARYQEAKQNAGVVDYNDLEHLCMKLLVVPEFDETNQLVKLSYTEVAKELSRFYREVYIDEYQDSNTVQETILKAVAEAAENEGPTRFMVGDMKQSIYRFRLANPLIFAEKYENWEKHQIEEAPEAPDVCIDLSQNFRSRDNILQGTNDIFEQIMSKQVGELEYDDYAKLKVGNLYTEGHPEEVPERGLSDAIELHLLETKEVEYEEEASSDEVSLGELKKVEWEALMVAHLIDQLLKGEGNPTHVFDKDLNGYRPVEPRDIVILLRATKEKAGVYETALLNKGIGAYADVSNSFFDAIEIQTIISYLKIIDNPLQDIPLITVLRSPIVGVDLDDLVVIRKSSETGGFYEALQAYLLRDDAKESVRAFMAELETYREQSSLLTIVELIDQLYVTSGYYRYVTMLPTGAKKKANLSLLKKYAEQFENSNNGKLFSFLLYLDKLSQTSEGLQEAKLIGENENLVRIMSIHKSKGLEFGVVFLCDTGKKFNNNDIMKSVLLHNELGLAPDYIDTVNYVKYPSIPKIAIKNQIISENISEEMRVLYVALTRAKEKLFITGTLSDLSRAASKWAIFGTRHHKEILPLGVKRGGSYLSWIGMSLFAHSNLNEIRAYSGSHADYLFEGKSKWQLKVWDKKSLQVETTEEENKEEDRMECLKHWDSEKVYGAYKEEINRRLDYVYPYEEAILLPTKLSVSEIKRAAYHPIDEMNEGAASVVAPILLEDKPVPSFMKTEEAIEGARRGTLIHGVFEHLDYLTYRTEEEIKDQLVKLIGEHKLQEEVWQVINIKRLVQLANSPMVERMRQADFLWKEKQFIYVMASQEVDETYAPNEEILLQGIVDACMVEEDGLTIIDYKTDYIDLKDKAHSLEKIKARYTKQLELYAEALGGIMKQPIKEKYIYLYQINEWLKL